MKKIVSILLAAALFLGGLVGCGKGEAERKGSTVSLPAADAQRTVVEQAGAMATRLFVLANLKTDALLEYDINNGSMEELQALTADALETWRLCDVASAKTMQLADYAQALHVQATTQAARMLYADSGGPSFSLFSTVAYAAEENAAVKWARELTEKFDSYPAGQKIKQLAENLGTDAKKAYAQLKMAQNILEGEAYSAEGDTMQKFENAAIVTKTVCKTGLYIGGVVAGGGVANGILEAGGIIIGGVDTIVDIASTGSTIICGENSKVTMAVNDLKDFMGPISSVAGGVNVLTGGIKFTGTMADKVVSIDKLSYIGESVLDLVREGKILGGLITVGKDGQTTVSMTEIDVEGKTPEEIEKELEKAGLSLPEDETAKTAAELVQEMEEEYYYTEEEISGIIEYLRELLYDMFLEPEEEPQKEEEPAEKPAGGGLSIDEVVGTYKVKRVDGEVEFLINITKSGNGQLSYNDDLIFDYDPNTSTATCSYENESGRGTADLMFAFKDGKIHLSIYWVYTNEEIDKTSVMESKGIKID
ncbi:MAG TPA: hypothetical protein GXX36_09630 [Clostridiaceae bacterium]|nr:hypothetical protein [Clostridiaceae bacterium]